MPYLYPTSVRKTSVYLPESLKDELSGLARRWDRSEAELLRLAVERLVHGARADTAPGTRARVREPGPRLVGVGVGPSDPELITERAVATVRDADRVVAASTAPDAIGRAEAVVRTAAPEVPVDRLVLDIGGDTAARAASLADAATAIVDTLDTGSVVAFLTLGDPNVYSTFPALAALVADLRPSVPITTVPGVMAFQELAAETGTVLAHDGEYLTVAVAGPDATPLDDLLADGHHTVVVYKGGRHLPAVASSLRDRDRLDGAVLGEMIGLPGGRCVPVATVADRPASYLATVVIPAIRDSRR
jgi:precorrin-2/cobalt-factor-2 C20-methyltransferase